MPPPEPPDASELVHIYAQGLTLPLDVAVKVPNARRASKIARPHVISSNISEGCFLDAGNGLFVSSPELCFIQMARELSLIKLIELGFELCGSYSLPVLSAGVAESGDLGNALKKHPPLTNHRKLTAFTARNRGERGAGRAARALRYIADGSASPMETILVMLLTLPYKLGGYCLPMPEMNARIRPAKSAKKSASKSYYSCDLFWPDLNVAAEYDSDAHHTGAERIASDSKRRNTLASIGIVVITVTKQQIKSVVETEKAASLLASNMGKRLRNNENPKFLGARHELRRLLFS